MAVNEAYDGLGATFDLYWQVYERNSIDDAGMPLNATVHFGQDYDNAFWNGQQMVFGDGGSEQQAVREAWSGVGINVPTLLKPKSKTRG